MTYPRIVEATVSARDRIDEGERLRLTQLRADKFMDFTDNHTVFYCTSDLTDITPLVTMEGGALPKVWRDEESGLITDGDRFTPATTIHHAIRDAKHAADKHHQWGWFYNAVARFLEAEEAEKQNETERLQELLDEANAQLEEYFTELPLQATEWAKAVGEVIAAGARLTLPKDTE
ncbi:hypothetical protein [Hoyosella altamirensis]|uniref:hypothetical protein n=1 Tax=Hoyosella altamirensis TaxID=616997 RepID=UPI0007DB5BD0|nr:hypothetical protein [Hoyosella altamirensis]